MIIKQHQSAYLPEREPGISRQSEHAQLQQAWQGNSSHTAYMTE